MDPVTDGDPTGNDQSRPPTLRSILEALLLVVEQPVSEDLLATVVSDESERGDRDSAAIRAELEEWRTELDSAGSGMELRRSGDGWRLYSRRALAPYVERLLTDGSRSTLTRAALETLAVIAYRQPVTRGRVSAVRGVNVDGVMRTLVARGLVVEAGSDEESGAQQYRTTELFLERMGLASLDELPDITPLLPDVDLVDEISDDPADDPRISVSRRNRGQSAVPDEGDDADPGAEE